MSTIDIIQNSIVEIQHRNITLVRGPLYVWGSGDVPEGCDCFGAVLICNNNHQRGFPKGWLREFLDTLGKDYIWFYKFNYGWSQNRVLETRVEHHSNNSRDGGEKYVWVEDKVSKSAVDLAKKFF